MEQVHTLLCGFLGRERKCKLVLALFASFLGRSFSEYISSRFGSLRPHQLRLVSSAFNWKWTHELAIVQEVLHHHITLLVLYRLFDCFGYFRWRFRLDVWNGRALNVFPGLVHYCLEGLLGHWSLLNDVSVAWLLDVWFGIMTLKGIEPLVVDDVLLANLWDLLRRLIVSPHSCSIHRHLRSAHSVRGLGPLLLHTSSRPIIETTASTKWATSIISWVFPHTQAIVVSPLWLELENWFSGFEEVSSSNGNLDTLNSCAGSFKLHVLCSCCLVCLKSVSTPFQAVGRHSLVSHLGSLSTIDDLLYLTTEGLIQQRTWLVYLAHIMVLLSLTALYCCS